MIKEEKFKVIQFIREFIFQIDKELDNFPKKDIEIKQRIRNESYDLLELCYEANGSSSDSNRKRLLEKSIAKIKVIDFLINLSYDRELITGKKYEKLGFKLDSIIKYTTGWIKAIDKNIT